MSQTMYNEAPTVGSRHTHTFYISNEAIENGMNMYDLHSIMVKTIKINQYLNEVKDVTTEIGNVHPPNHP